MYLELTEMIFFLFAAFIFQIIIHELGHLFFGLVSGYKFISLRLFGFTIAKNRNRLVFKIYRLKGSVGQCLMYPPEKVDYRYKLITLGGIIMNTITANIAVFLMIYNHLESSIQLVALFLFAFYGYGMAFISILPSIPLSDGASLKELKNKSARGYNRKQLLIALNLMEGFTYKKLPEEIYVVPEGESLGNSIIGYHKILESYYYMDRNEWGKAKTVLEVFDKENENLPKSIRYIVASEKLFLALRENQTPFMRNIELEDYLKGKGDINFQRVKTAYYIYRNQNDKDRYRKVFIKNTKNYAYPGEVVFSQKLLEEIPYGDKDEHIWI